MVVYFWSSKIKSSSSPILPLLGGANLIHHTQRRSERVLGFLLDGTKMFLRNCFLSSNALKRHVPLFVAGSSPFQCQRMLSNKETLSKLWDDHLFYEFDEAEKSVEKTMDTMVDNPSVNHVPTLIGGAGKEKLSHFYRHHFIFSNPDFEMTTISRTVGESSLVDEFVATFTHDRPIDWLLPGVAPTHQTISIPMVVIVQFEKENGDTGEWKLKSERIYWDQASCLVQAKVLENENGLLPIVGKEQALKVMDPSSVPYNSLMEKKKE